MRNKFRYIFSSILKLFGFLFALILLISFTSLPYYAYHQLAAVDITLEKEPRAIIVLSGVGMPSPDALIKLYFASKAAKQFPNSSIYIALPEKALFDFLYLKSINRAFVPENFLAEARFSFDKNFKWHLLRRWKKLIPLSRKRFHAVLDLLFKKNG